MAMMKSLFYFLSVAVASPILMRDAPTLPSQDSFYIQPSNIASFKPGQVVRGREIPAGLSGIIDNVSAQANLKTAYQYLYRTTDPLENAVAAVTTLLVPDKNADPTKLLAYQTAYDTANNNCSPSYGLRSGANTTEVSDIAFIVAALDRGWYVVTSDYEGLRAEYTAGLMAGYATLDSVRAALNRASESGLRRNARYAMWGYSGGSIASEWAAELQPKYAPELNFQGAALGGLIPDVTNVLKTINRGPFAGLAFSGITGLTRIWPNATKFLNDNLIADKKSEFESIAAGCLSQAISAGSNKDLYSYFVRGEATFEDTIPKQILQTNGLMGTHGTPKFPLFFYKSAGDEVSPVGDTDALYQNLCTKGATIQYNRDLLGEHISEAITGSGPAIEWVADRLNGIPVFNQGYCVLNTVVLTGLDLGAFVGVAGNIIALLRAAL